MCYVLCSASSSLTVLLLLDCLLMLVYKDKSERAKGHKERSSMTLEDICGLDPGLSYEGLNHTLAIICLSQVVMLGFENKETMYAWDVRIRYSLGEGNLCLLTLFFFFFPRAKKAEKSIAKMQITKYS